MNFNDKTFQAVCRVCRKPVLRQNYKDHLKDVHKGEDLLDQRQWGDPDNRDQFRGLTSSGDKNHNVRRTEGKGTLGQKQAQTLLEPKEYGLKKMSWERICLMWWKISHRQTEEMMSPRAEHYSPESWQVVNMEYLH